MTVDGLPLFPILPNWQDGILERVAFLTDILTSETGREQRRSVRRYPRRSIEASFLRTGADRQRLDNFAIGIRKRPFYVPLWFEQYRPAGGFTTGQIWLTFPAGTLIDREFRTNDWAIITSGDPNDYEIVKIGHALTDTDSAPFINAPTRDWPEGTRIIPLRRARLLDTVTLDAHTDFVGTTSIRFEIDEPENFYGPSWGHCSPLFRFVPDRAGPISLGFENDALSLDNESGVIFSYDPSERARINERLNVMLRGRANVARFRRFLSAARGRAVRFWCPSFTHDVTPAGDISSASMSFDALPNGFSEYFPRPQDARLMLSFTFRDGRPPVYRQVASVTPVGISTITAERFVLEVAAPPMQVADLARVQFVMPSRFDQDTFELHHDVDDGAVVRTTVVVRSSDIDDMPPIDCWVTSKPYPLDVSESLSPSLTLLGGNLATMLFHAYLDIPQPVLTGGELRALLITQPSREPEAFDVLQPTLTGGELRALLITQPSREPEAFNVIQPTLTGGELETKLVTYAGWPDEGFNMLQPTLTGGELV